MAAHSSFGPAGRSQIVTLARKDGLRIPVHRELADLIAMLMDLTEMSGLDIRPRETWGYAYRKIAGTNKMSNHSWGTAVDINAPANPYQSASWHSSNGNTTVRGKRLRTEFNSAQVKLWEDHGFRWGGWYRTKPDPMHFEFMGTVSDARAYTRRLRDFLAAQGRPAPAAPTRSGQRVLHEGLEGDDVKLWQQLVGVPVTGRFGPETKAATAAFQKKVKINADGVAGPITQQKMRDVLAFVAAHKHPAHPTLRRGDSGAGVRHLQERLNVHGFGLKVDGDFGPGTDTAVRRFQKGKGLRADGVVGSNTWAKLG